MNAPATSMMSPKAAWYLTGMGMRHRKHIVARAIASLPIALAALIGCGAAPCPDPQRSEIARAPSRRPAPAPSPPRGSILVRPVGVTASMEGFMLVLADEARERMLPVVIGASEAQIIDLRMRGEDFDRPLTHDLLDAAIETLGGEVVFVHIDKLRGGIFVASISIWDGRETHRIDARTSDAVAVALGNDAPIYVAPIVLEEQALPSEEAPFTP
jgi:bifunctional DNase/RNase